MRKGIYRTYFRNMMYSERAKSIFEAEITELRKVSEAIGTEVNAAVDMMFQCQGKIVVSGIGKTGTIGHKIASSLASTGTPAIFINAAEALHGDLGMISPDDIALLISNSGNSSELLNMINPLRRIGCRIIAMTGNITSPLAIASDITLNIHVDREVCPLGLAPTTSATAALVMGDALMICLMEKRDFKADNYALYHPGGALGRKLMYKVKDKMTSQIPRVNHNASFRDIVEGMSNGKLGMTLVFDDANAPLGIITDGDIRRAIQRFDDVKSISAEQIMSKGYKSIGQHQLLTDALELMDANNITTLVVVNSEKDDALAGILSIHHIIDFK